ncbi:MAG: ATP-binding protein [Bifidobacterium sp.]|jgi:predicted kinase|nr:ATP-binding protein [Bifidobacterium sp.]
MSQSTQSMAAAFFIIGPAGSGKSCLAEALVSRLHGAYVDKDIICNGFTGELLKSHGYDSSERDGNAYYLSELMSIEYKTLLKVGTSNMQLGTPAVFDAPFGAYFKNDDFINRVREKYRWPDEVDAVVVHVAVDGDTVRKRLITRGLQRDSWKLEHWNEFWSKTSGTKCQWKGALHVTVDNNIADKDYTADINSILHRTGH